MLICLSADSRDEVDATLARAVAAGGKAVATSSSQVSMCASVPGSPVATVSDVTVA